MTLTEGGLPCPTSRTFRRLPAPRQSTFDKGAPVRAAPLAMSQRHLHQRPALDLVAGGARRNVLVPRSAYLLGNLRLDEWTLDL